ncbi:hypothetical protein FCV25MIE_18248 [Fagus crenata]
MSPYDSATSAGSSSGSSASSASKPAGSMASSPELATTWHNGLSVSRQPWQKEAEFIRSIVDKIYSDSSLIVYEDGDSLFFSGPRFAQAIAASSKMSLTEHVVYRVYHNNSFLR